MQKQEEKTEKKHESVLIYILSAAHTIIWCAFPDSTFLINQIGVARFIKVRGLKNSELRYVQFLCAEYALFGGLGQVYPQKKFKNWLSVIESASNFG